MYLLGRNRAAVLVALAVYAYCYILRFILIVSVPESAYFLVPEIAWGSFSEPAVQAQSFLLLMLNMVVFCFTVIIFQKPLVRAAKNEYRPLSRLTANQLLIYSLLWLTIYLTLKAVALAYGIGIQGVFVEDPLPFKLTGAVVYSTKVLLPALMMLLIYWTDANGEFIRSRILIILLLTVGLLEMFASLSRGALLVQILLLGLMCLSGGIRIKRSDIVLLCIGVVAVIIIIPLVTDLRHGLESVASNSLDGLGATIDLLLFRLSGIDQLMVILHLGSRIPVNDVLDVLISPRGVNGYYTEVILGYDSGIPQTFSASGLGWLYLVGGGALVALGGFVLGIIATWGWRKIGQNFNVTAPITKAFYLQFIIGVMTDAAMDSVFISFLVVFILMSMIERIVK